MRAKFSISGGFSSPNYLSRPVRSAALQSVFQAKPFETVSPLPLWIFDLLRRGNELASIFLPLIINQFLPMNMRRARIRQVVFHAVEMIGETAQIFRVHAGLIG